MRECIIENEERDRLNVVHVRGSLDAYSFPRLESLLSELQDAHRTRVVLDCEHIDYMSSAALGILIGFTRRVREDGGDLKLVNLPGKIYNIIELLGFHKLLEIYDRQDDAIQAFEG